MSNKVLAGRYELFERVGEGGMSVVYKAKDKLLNRFVAIKILKPEFINDHKFIDSFRRESQAAASLSHPNIVNIYDVGREGNIHYIVMELIQGKTLSDYIKEQGPMPYPKVIALSKQIAAALAFAHKNHIIHRDVKPHNVMITPNGTAEDHRLWYRQGSQCCDHSRQYRRDHRICSLLLAGTGKRRVCGREIRYLLPGHRDV